MERQVIVIHGLNGVREFLDTLADFCLGGGVGRLYSEFTNALPVVGAFVQESLGYLSQ